MDSQVDLFIIKLVVCCLLLSALAFPTFCTQMITVKKKKSNQSIKKSKTFIKTCT